LQWEIIERRYDKEEEDKASGVIAIIKFTVTSRPQYEFFQPFLSFDEQQRRSFILEMDEDDIEELIEDLNQIKSRIVKERGE
jgi:hypothetical protein